MQKTWHRAYSPKYQTMTLHSCYELIPSWIFFQQRCLKYLGEDFGWKRKVTWTKRRWKNPQVCKFQIRNEDKTKTTCLPQITKLVMMTPKEMTRRRPRQRIQKTNYNFVQTIQRRHECTRSQKQRAEWNVRINQDIKTDFSKEIESLRRSQTKMMLETHSSNKTNKWKPKMKIKTYMESRVAHGCEENKIWETRKLETRNWIIL